MKYPGTICELIGTQYPLVITSYSIHYTKLYDHRSDVDSRFFCLFQSNPYVFFRKVYQRDIAAPLCKMDRIPSRTAADIKDSIVV